MSLLYNIILWKICKELKWILDFNKFPDFINKMFRLKTAVEYSRNQQSETNIVE